ncbi:choline phosphate cytidylyltransferase [Rhizina undulata]
MTDTLPQHPPAVAIPMAEDRIWIDGCFDFTHHGHAGAILQAKQLGKYLVVGVHSDAEILDNKGPTVMTLKERMAAVEACKWTNLAVPSAPYVTDPHWMDLYGCRYVVHGDDVTTDSTGEDCYRLVKEQGRFRMVPRTPGISTTDLVGRMLLCTKTHHIRGFGRLLLRALDGDFGDGLPLPATGEGVKAMLKRVGDYASDVYGQPGKGCTVFTYSATPDTCIPLISGAAPKEGQSVVYVDGGFDLFSTGHIEFLRLVVQAEKERGNDPYVIAGVHSDATINRWKGLNYPIMNLYERGLCVLQCRYVNSVVFSAPFIPTKSFLESLPYWAERVYHGPTKFMPGEEDTYKDAKEMGVFRDIEDHDWVHVNAGEIVKRIVGQREMYEERQRRKGVKSEKEVTMTNLSDE